MIRYVCTGCDQQLVEIDARPCKGGKIMAVRPDWDDYFNNIAKAVSLRADCRRAQHGAVIVQSKRIVATGYNGSPAGSPLSCLKGDCPRGLMSYEQLASLTGGYDECLAVHAEANAIVHSNRSDCIDATIYVTGKPCPGCEKLIRASGIRRVVWPTGSFWV